MTGEPTPTSTERSLSTGRRACVWVLAPVVVGTALGALPSMLRGETRGLDAVLEFPSHSTVIAWVMFTSVSAILSSTAAALCRRLVQQFFAGAAAITVLGAFGLYVWMLISLRSARLDLAEAGASAVRECLRNPDVTVAEYCLPNVRFPDLNLTAVAMILAVILVAVAALPGRTSWSVSVFAGAIVAIPGLLALRVLITETDIETRIGWSGLITPLALIAASMLWGLRAGGVRPWGTFAGAIGIPILGVVLQIPLAEAESYPFDLPTLTANDGGAALFVLLLWALIMITATHIAWLRRDRLERTRASMPA